MRQGARFLERWSFLLKLEADPGFRSGFTRPGANTQALRSGSDRPLDWLPRRVLIAARQELDIFRRLLRLAEGFRGYLLPMSALALLASVFEGVSLALIIPLVQILDAPTLPGDQGHLLLQLLYARVTAIPVEMRLIIVLATIVGAIIVKSAINYANMALLVVVYGHISHNLRQRIFANALQRPLSDIEREPSGRLLNILNNETWRAADALNNLFAIITTVATMVVFLTLLFLLSWRLSLVAVVFMAIIPPFVQLITWRVKRVSGLSLEANEGLAQRTWTALNCVRIIHAFGRETFEASRFSETSDKVRRLFLKLALISMTTGPVTEVLVTCVVALLAFLVNKSHVNVGILVAFLAILYRLQPRLMGFVSALASLRGMHAPIMAVSAALAPLSRPVSNGKRQFLALQNGLQFKSLTFTHKGASRPAISEVSFDAAQGNIIALAGPSGAGKSTLLDLLLQFYRPQRGEILADGIPIREFELSSWRAHLAVVSQDPYIFDDTIRANILYGRPEASEAEMVNAASLACADDFIRQLPLGYDTRVGERGMQISGGQRQRLALARALVRDPDILILDEATNALDTLTERAFQEALERFARHRLVFVVAHRLATIENADRVVVFDAGHVVETGTPRTLLAAGGWFSKLFLAQHRTASDNRSGNQNCEA
jgi:ABC-type multidrug transport system fused ATPase/permease subunit